MSDIGNVSNTSDTLAISPLMQTSNPPVEKQQTKSLTSYIIFGLIIVLICVLLYYGYRNWDQKCKDEAFTLEQERDDLQMSFSLRDELQKLKTKQKNILSSFSNDLGI